MTPSHLLQHGDFRLSSGTISNLRIECDALTDEDIETCARLIIARVPRFSQVVPVPRGGDRLAEALRPRCTPGADLFLVVDDVLTTGASIGRTRATIHPETRVHGAVIFDRRSTSDPYQPLHWVTSLFTLTPVRPRPHS